MLCIFVLFHTLFNETKNIRPANLFGVFQDGTGKCCHLLGNAACRTFSSAHRSATGSSARNHHSLMFCPFNSGTSPGGRVVRGTPACHPLHWVDGSSPDCLPALSNHIWLLGLLTYKGSLNPLDEEHSFCLSWPHNYVWLDRCGGDLCGELELLVKYNVPVLVGGEGPCHFSWPAGSPYSSFRDKVGVDLGWWWSFATPGLSSVEKGNICVFFFSLISVPLDYPIF